MSLIQLWEKNPDIVSQKNIKQLVALAGDGNLLDGSDCSKEINHYLNQCQPEKLAEYIKFCLTDGFDKSGAVLQDLINEVGRRLGYDVEQGLYSGRSNQIGFDGIWKSPDGQSIVIESKTTDAYRINLDIIAGYRNRLVDGGRITKKSSILIVVGRQDTGDLEAQIRGSRHAWDTRVISMEALLQLLELNIKSDEEETTAKIRSLLVPFEYTRLDNIIDIMFTTAKDVESTIDTVEDFKETISTADKNISYNKQEHTSKEILDKVRKISLDGLALRENTTFIAYKRAQFWNIDKKIRAVCIVSKRYSKGNYWFIYHPHQDRFLADGEKSFYLLGCADSSITYALPYKVINELLPYLNTTEKEDARTYWHIHIRAAENGSYEMLVPKRSSVLNLKPYEIVLNSSIPKQGAK